MGIMDSLLGGLKNIVDSAGESMVDTARRNSREANDTQLKNLYQLCRRKYYENENKYTREAFEIMQEEMERRGLL